MYAVFKPYMENKPSFAMRALNWCCGYMIVHAFGLSQIGISFYLLSLHASVRFYQATYWLGFLVTFFYLIFWKVVEHIVSRKRRAAARASATTTKTDASANSKKAM
jgi:hypothetical protein